MEGGNDPYEQQLLAVFESCDLEQQGSLDGGGLSQLCEQLELEEQGLQLIDRLVGSDPSRRVTFTDFRDALLALLGEGQRQSEDTPSQGSADPNASVPEREISPKFVFGKKKYGRRSRPESTEQNIEDINEDDSDTEILVPVPNEGKEIIMRSMSESSNLDSGQMPKKRRTSLEQSQNLKRSTSLPGPQSMDARQAKVSDWQPCPEAGDGSMPPSLLGGSGSEEQYLRATWERLGVGMDGFLDREELAVVCECIGMEKVAEEVIQQLFEKLDVDRDGRISFEEFLLLFRSGGSWPQGGGITDSPSHSHCAGASLENQRRDKCRVQEDRQTLSSGPEKDSSFLTLDPTGSGMVSGELIAEIWDSSGVPHASRFLNDLGFSPDQQISLTDLSVVLEEELRTIGEEERDKPTPYTVLLQAALSLYQSEVRWLKSSLEHVNNERDKLRADIAEANQRASLLAQEVDDHHARLEKSSQLQVKLLEQRHAEQVRELQEQLALEREQLTVQNLRVEQQLTSLQEEETKLRGELSAAQMDNETLEKENQGLTEQVAEAEELSSQLQKEVESLSGLQQRLSELEASRELIHEEQVRPLLERLQELQTENTGLRDRNDELTMQLETVTSKLAASKLRRQNNVQSEAGEDVSIESSSCGSSGATKRRGEMPLGLHNEDSSEEESPRIGKVRRYGLEVSLENVKLEGLQIQPTEFEDKEVRSEIETEDGEAPMSLSPTKLVGVSEGDSVSEGSVATQSEELPLLRAKVAELEHTVQLKTEQLLFCQSENEKLRKKCEDKVESGSKSCDRVKKPERMVKGELKQVFQQIREQILQELVEDNPALSSLQLHYESLLEEKDRLHAGERENLLQQLKTGDEEALKSRITMLESKCNELMHLQKAMEMEHEIQLQRVSDEGDREVEELQRKLKELCQRFQNTLMDDELAHQSMKPVDSQTEIQDLKTENAVLRTKVKYLEGQLNATLEELHVGLEREAQERLKRVELEDKLRELEYKSAGKGSEGRSVLGLSTLPAIKEEMEDCTDGCSQNHQKTTSEVKQLEKHCRDLESKLDQVKVEIVKMLSEKEACSKENCTLKSHISALENKFTMGSSGNSSIDSQCCEEGCERTNQCCTMFEASSSVSFQVPANKNVELSAQVRDATGEMKNQCDKYAKEKNELQERCFNLENSLELLRLEYEKCEDYWQNKLEEERRLYEQEQKLTDEKFTELESKIREYEELLGQDDKSDDSDRLSTIEERSCLEKQVTDLEEECEDLRQQMEKVQSEQEESLEKVEVLWRQRLQEREAEMSERLQALERECSRYKDLVNRTLQHQSQARDAAVQAGKLENGIRENHKTFIVQLDAEKKAVLENCNGILNGSGPRKKGLPDIEADEQSCQISLNVLQSLNARLRHGEQKSRHLQVALKQQQLQAEKILHDTWQQHREEIANLNAVVQNTQEKLNQQIVACKEQSERLARSDVLVKELYVENAYLVSTIQRLEQRCFVLNVAE